MSKYFAHFTGCLAGSARVCVCVCARVRAYAFHCVRPLLARSYWFLLPLCFVPCLLSLSLSGLAVFCLSSSPFFSSLRLLLYYSAIYCTLCRRLILTLSLPCFLLPSLLSEILFNALRLVKSAQLSVILKAATWLSVSTGYRLPAICASHFAYLQQQATTCNEGQVASSEVKFWSVNSRWQSWLSSACLSCAIYVIYFMRWHMADGWPPIAGWRGDVWGCGVSSGFGVRSFF